MRAMKVTPKVPDATAPPAWVNPANVEGWQDRADGGSDLRLVSGRVFVVFESGDELADEFRHAMTPSKPLN